MDSFAFANGLRLCEGISLLLLKKLFVCFIGYFAIS